MHSEAYRKSIVVKRESHNPQPALPLPLPASSCSPLVIYLSPPRYLLESLIPPQHRHLLCTSNTVLLWSLCIRIPRGRSRNFQSFGIRWKRSRSLMYQKCNMTLPVYPCRHTHSCGSVKMSAFSMTSPIVINYSPLPTGVQSFTTFFVTSRWCCR